MQIDERTNKRIEYIKLKLKTIPNSPGVYQHLDEDGRVIYVGKARNLQRRVSSYFTNFDEKSAKIRMLVRNIYDIRVTVVATEVDALLLENTLIKQYQPRYNSMLKDDKTYPYLCITNEDYPRIVFTRNKSQINGQFFGPYPNQRILRELQSIIRDLFSYRTCNKNLRCGEHGVCVTEAGSRPCIKHQIGLCKAPCSNLQSHEDYINTINGIRHILKGDLNPMLDKMRKEMLLLADQLRFEEAEVMKRRIRLLEEYQSHSTVVDTNIKDVDVYSISSNEKYAYVNIMRVKQGSVVYSFSTEIKKRLDESDEEIMATAIPTLHEQTESSAKEMIVPFHIDDIPEEYLHQNIPTKGDKKKLLELSARNNLSYQHQCNHQRMLVDPEASNLKLLTQIQKALHLDELPVNIECFDNSNIQGAFPVAAMVRFTNGKPNKSEYRKFNIKTVEGADDYASMAEVIYRRYKRLSDEGKALPQLLIVDGGKGQMDVANRVIAELGLNIPIAGLAKNDKHHTSELLYGNPPKQIGLKPSDPLFHLLERIQNEVHRFAITFHKNKRSKGTFRTQLSDIDGIGEKTAQKLLLRFGSVKQIKQLPLEDLCRAIGSAKAKQVYTYFNQQ